MVGPVRLFESTGFRARLDLKIAGMGLFEDIARMDSITYKGNGSEKEADCSWRPWKSRPLGTARPTLVESVVSKCRDGLAANAHW